MFKISVIIPSYNQSSFIEETIESVLNQNYPELELIIIDGNSNDGSQAIIEKYKDKITYWVSEKDSGQSEAINKGFQKATGDIVTWLCSDDSYTSGTLITINSLFQKATKETGLIHGNAIIFDSNNFKRTDKGYSNQNIERSLSGMTFPQPASFIKKEFLEKAGRLKEDLHYGMDFELFSRLAMICEFQYANIEFANYRLHDQSKSTTAISKFIDEWILIFTSIVNGLDLAIIRNELNKLNITSKQDQRITSYFNDLKSTKNIDQQEMLFYFLCNVLRYDYITEKFDRGKSIALYLKNNFNKMMKKEPEINKIVDRIIILPPIFIRSIRKIKKRFSQR